MVTYILNIIDMIITLYVLNNGATELNPIANALIVSHPLLFIFYKTIVIGVLCCFLSYRKQHGNNFIDKNGLGVCTIAYTFVFLWHIFNLVIA